jgi:ssDNA-binding replication factor A large subunit
MKGSILINKYILDVIGVVKSTSDMQTIVSKASQKEFNKREVLLVDEKASISVTLWGQQVSVIFCGEKIFLMVFFQG